MPKVSVKFFFFLCHFLSLINDKREVLPCSGNFSGFFPIFFFLHAEPALKCLVRKRKNHSTQDSRVVPHRGTNWAALRLTAQIGRDAVLSESYGRG